MAGTCPACWACLEATQLQNVKTAREGTHSLLERWVADTDAPELFLAGISVHICQVLLHGLEAGGDSSAIVWMCLLQLYQLGSNLLTHCADLQKALACTSTLVKLLEQILRAVMCHRCIAKATEFQCYNIQCNKQGHKLAALPIL